MIIWIMDMQNIKVLSDYNNIKWIIGQTIKKTQRWRKW